MSSVDVSFYKTRLEEREQELIELQATFNKHKLKSKVRLDQLKKDVAHYCTNHGLPTSENHAMLLIRLAEMEDALQLSGAQMDDLSLELGRKQMQLNDQAIVIRNLEEQLRVHTTLSTVETEDRRSPQQLDVDSAYQQIVYKDKRIVELNNAILDKERHILDLQEMCREQKELANVKSQAMRIVQNKFQETEGRKRTVGTETDSFLWRGREQQHHSAHGPRNNSPGHAVANRSHHSGGGRSPPPLDPSEVDDRRDEGPSSSSHFFLQSKNLDQEISLRKKQRKHVTFDLPPSAAGSSLELNRVTADEDIAAIIAQLSLENEQLQRTVDEQAEMMVQLEQRMELADADVAKAVRESKNASLKARAVAQARIKDLEDRMAKVNQEHALQVERLQTETETLRSTREWEVEQNAKLRDQIAHSKERIHKLTEELTGSEEMNRDIEAKLAYEKQLVDGVVDELAEAEDAVTFLEHQKENILDDVDRLKEALLAQDQLIEILEADIVIYENHIGLLRETLGASKVDHRSLLRSKAFETKLKALEQEKEQINIRSNEDRLRSKALAAKVKMLEEENERLTALQCEREMRRDEEESMAETCRQLELRFKQVEEQMQTERAEFELRLETAKIEAERKAAEASSLMSELMTAREELSQKPAGSSWKSESQQTLVPPQESMQELQSLREQVRTQTVELEGSQQEVFSLNERLDSLRAENFDLRDQMQDLNCMIAEQRDQLADERRLFYTLEAEYGERNKLHFDEHADLTRQTEEAQSRVEELEQQLVEISGEKDALQIEMDNARRSLQETVAVKRELEVLKLELDEQRNHTSAKWEEVCKKVMEQDSRTMPESRKNSMEVQHQQYMIAYEEKISRLESELKMAQEKIEHDKQEKRKLKAAVKQLKDRPMVVRTSSVQSSDQPKIQEEVAKKETVLLESTAPVDTSNAPVAEDAIPEIHCVSDAVAESAEPGGPPEEAVVADQLTDRDTLQQTINDKQSEIETLKQQIQKLEVESRLSVELNVEMGTHMMDVEAKMDSIMKERDMEHMEQLLTEKELENQTALAEGLNEEVLALRDRLEQLDTELELMREERGPESVDDAVEDVPAGPLVSSALEQELETLRDRLQETLVEMQELRESRQNEMNEKEKNLQAIKDERVLELETALREAENQLAESEIKRKDAQDMLSAQEEKVATRVCELDYSEALIQTREALVDSGSDNILHTEESELQQAGLEQLPTAQTAASNEVVLKELEETKDALLESQNLYAAIYQAYGTVSDSYTRLQQEYEYMREYAQGSSQQVMDSQTVQTQASSQSELGELRAQCEYLNREVARLTEQCHYQMNASQQPITNIETVTIQQMESIEMPNATSSASVIDPNAETPIVSTLPASTSSDIEVENSLLRQHVFESQQVQDDISQDVEKLLGLRNELETAVEALKGEIWSLNGQLKASVLDRENLQDRLVDLDVQLSSEKRRADGLDAELSEQVELTHRAQREAAEAENESNRRLAECLEMETSREELEKAYAQLTEYYNQLQAAYNALYAKVQALDNEEQAEEGESEQGRSGQVVSTNMEVLAIIDSMIQELGIEILSDSNLHAKLMLVENAIKLKLSELSESRQALEEQRSTSSALQSRLQALEDEVQVSASDVKNTKEKLSEVEADLEWKQDECISLSRRVTELQSALDAIVESETKDDESARLATRQADVDSLFRTNAELAHTNVRLQNEIERLGEEMEEKATREVDGSVQSTSDDVHYSPGEARKKVEQLEEEIKTLKETIVNRDAALQEVERRVQENVLQTAADTEQVVSEEQWGWTDEDKDAETAVLEARVMELETMLEKQTTSRGSDEEVSRLRNVEQTLTNRVEALENQLSEADENMQRMEEELLDDRTDMKEKDNNIKRLAERCRELEQQLTEHQTAHEELRQSSASAAAWGWGDEEESGEKEAEQLVEESGQVQELQQKLQSFQKEKEELEAELFETRENLAELEKSLENMQTTVTQKEFQLAELRKQVEQSRAQDQEHISILKSELETSKCELEEIQTMRLELAELRDERSVSRERHQKAEQEIAGLKAELELKTDSQWNDDTWGVQEDTLNSQQSEEIREQLANLVLEKDDMAEEILDIQKHIVQLKTQTTKELEEAREQVRRLEVLSEEQTETSNEWGWDSEETTAYQNKENAADNEELTSLRAEVEELRKKLMEENRNAGERLAALQSQLDETLRRQDEMEAQYFEDLQESQRNGDVRLKNVEMKLEDKENAATKLAEQINELSLAVVEKNRIIDELQKEGEDAQARYLTLEAELELLTNQLEEAERRSDQMNRECMDLRQRNIEAENLVQSNEDVEDIKALLDACKHEISTLRDRLEMSEQQNSLLKDSEARLIDSVDEFGLQMEKYQEEAARLQGVVNVLEKERNDIRLLLEESEMEKERLSEELEQMRTNISRPQSSASNNDTVHRLETAITERNRLASELSLVQGQLQTVEKDKHTLKSQCDQLRQRLIAKRTAIATASHNASRRSSVAPETAPPAASEEVPEEPRGSCDSSVTVSQTAATGEQPVRRRVRN